MPEFMRRPGVDARHKAGHDERDKRARCCKPLYQRHGRARPGHPRLSCLLRWSGWPGRTCARSRKRWPSSWLLINTSWSARRFSEGLFALIAASSTGSRSTRRGHCATPQPVGRLAAAIVTLSSDDSFIQNCPATVRRTASGSTGCSTRSSTPFWHTAVGAVGAPAGGKQIAYSASDLSSEP